MTAIAFLARFPAADRLGGEFGHDLTETWSTRFYTNAAGEVGEAREHRRTTVATYRLLDPTDAAMALDFYRAEAARRARDEAVLAAIRPLLGQLSDAGLRALGASLPA